MHQRTAVAVAVAICSTAGSAAGQATATGPERPAELTRLGAYVGEWRAEHQEAQDGRGFRFGYSLSWYDARRTIVEMLITQHFDDGEVRTLWKGFKGLNPTSAVVYYHGFSPSGRAARGEVTVEGDALLTTYDGWGPAGAPVRIQDRFLPVANDGFVSVTSMWRDGAWDEITRDRWARTAGP